jgi:hypothetical protein
VVSSGTSKVALKLPLAVVLTVVGVVDVLKPPMVMVTVWVCVVVVPVKPRPVTVTTVSLPPEAGLMLMLAWVVKVRLLTEVTAVLGPKAVRV